MNDEKTRSLQAELAKIEARLSDAPPSDDAIDNAILKARATRLRREILCRTNVLSPCRWTQDDLEDSWNGSCGARWRFEDGGPADNKMRFCPFCGLRLEQERIG